MKTLTADQIDKINDAIETINDFIYGFVGDCPGETEEALDNISNIINDDFNDTK